MLLGWHNASRGRGWDDEILDLMWRFGAHAEQSVADAFGGVPRSDAQRARDWWLDVAKALVEHYETAGEHETALSAEYTPALAAVAFALADGRIPDIVEHVRSRGTPHRRRSEILAIEVASHYIACARAGIIADKSPIKTITANFNVARQTAQRWARIPVDPERLLPCDQRLRAVMEAAGAEYSLASRSPHAVEARFRSHP